MLQCVIYVTPHFFEKQKYKIKAIKVVLELFKLAKQSCNTVELRWLELVGTVGASSTHPCVRAIPSLTIFMLVHVYFMSSRTPRFYRPKLQSARDICH